MYTFSLCCVCIVLGIIFLRLCFCVYDEHKVTKKLFLRFPWIIAFQRAIISPLIEWLFVIVGEGVVIALCFGCVWFLFSLVGVV